MNAHQVVKTIQKKIRKGLARNGTRVETNDGDPCGDGDQTPIRNQAHQQFYRNLFSEGGDLAECFNYGAISEFSLACVSGNVTLVTELLQQADRDPARPSEGLVKLLETRETSLRMTPLLLIVSAGKNLAFGMSGGSSLFAQNQVQVACVKQKKTIDTKSNRVIA